VDKRQQHDQSDWQQRITDWKATKQSGVAYCREHGLSYQRFCYWRRKLLSSQRVQNNASAGFVRVVPPQSPTAASELRVSLPGGIVISGLHADNVSLLIAILRQL